MLNFIFSRNIANCIFTFKLDVGIDRMFFSMYNRNIENYF